jgi:hypothetical protein
MKTNWMLAALAGLSLALPLHAADRKASKPTLTELAATYNAQPADIHGLRDKGWSWNEIGDALAVSKRSGRPLQEIVAQRDSGMSWNQISERYGFKFTDVSAEARRVAKDARRAHKEEGQAVKSGERRDIERGAGRERPTDPETSANPDTRDPTSQGPDYPQNPGGPGDSQNPDQTNPPHAP